MLVEPFGPLDEIWLRGKTFFVLNSTGHEISTAHKNLTAEKYRLFLLSNSKMLHLSFNKC